MAIEQRLIDLDKIKPMDFPSTEMDGLDVVQYLNTLPTVDAVEVVRCKDCKYAKSMAYIGESDYEIGECHLRKEDEIEFMVYDDDFCSYGERRTDNA